MPEKTSENQDGKTQRVLLVEDYEPNVLVLSSLLSELGYSCDVALNGEEALRKSASSYAAILMDIQLPDIDGMEVTRRIRRQEKTEGRESVPIIALSARATEDDRKLCLKAGMNDCLSKPIQLHELGAKLAELV